MTFEQAMKLSTCGIAVRFHADGRMLNYCSGAAPPTGISPAVQGHEEGFIRRSYSSKPMPPDYAGIYTDWRPWKGKDPITALGDIVRLVQCVVGRTSA